MKYRKLTAIVLASTLLTACAGQDGITREGMGTAAGAVAGGVVGSTIGGGTGKTLAVVGGALLGGALGNVIGRNMDEQDKAMYGTASQRALNTGNQQTWNNPETGNYGTVTPTRQYTDRSGRICREYRQVIYIDGDRHEDVSTACMNADGTWRLVG